MRIRVIVLMIVLTLPSIARGQSAAFTPVPCPSQEWQYTDPTFQALPGAKAFFGRYEGGLYQIEVPEQWNGELVLYAHGAVRNDGPTGSVLRVQTPVLREHLIRGNYAWAASSYRCNGSVYGVGLLDTMALSEVLRRVNPGRNPSRTYIVGQSLGGRVAILGLREFPQQFAGALAMCPAGQETNDVRAAIAAAAEVVTGVTLQPGNLDEGIARMAAIIGAPTQYTDKGRQLASIEIQMTGGPRPFAMEGLASRVLANVRDGVDMEPDIVARAAKTDDAIYRIDAGLGITSEELNRRARRKEPEGNLRTRSGPYPEALPFDGKLERPLLTIQGTGDLQVPVAQQRALKRAAIAAGKENMLVQRLMRIPGHCQFSEQEQATAFQDLVTWVRDGKRPDGDDVMGDLLDAGRKFTNPLRPGDPGTRSVVPGS